MTEKTKDSGIIPSLELSDYENLSKTRTPRVLIVDDSKNIHDDFRRILAPEPSRSDSSKTLEVELFGETDNRVPFRPIYRLDFASNGQTALEMIERSRDNDPYSLAFVDVRMPPGWDGVETTQHLWSADPNLQVVLCTAYSDHSWESIISCLGHSHRLLILKKPFDSTEVLQISSAMTEKWALLRQKQFHMKNLERIVLDRTRKLEFANRQLRKEMEVRLLSEKKLQRAAKLESLGQLTAGIAHEINNPLSFLAGNIHFLREQLVELDERHSNGTLKDLLEALDEANEGARRIKHIIQDIMLFSRVEDDNLSEVRVEKVVDSCLKLVGNELRHTAEVIKEYHPVPRVLGTFGRLEQVFVNLLTNAIHAMSEYNRRENKLIIKISSSSRKFVNICIQDTGIGVSPEMIERIFDPFFTTKPIGKGTGLGLSICHGIIKALGGEISIKSEYGVGTTVDVFLLSSYDKTKMNHQVPSIDTVGVNLESQKAREFVKNLNKIPKLLVIDDEILVLRMISRILHEFDITVATNGRRAIELCKENDFDFILCDLMMPGLSGMETFLEISNNLPQYRHRFAFMTGGVFSMEVQTFLENLVHPCLEKPWSADTLRNFVCEHLKRIAS